MKAIIPSFFQRTANLRYPNKNVIVKLALVWWALTGLHNTAWTQSGTVTFTTTEGTNIGQIPTDGTYSNDILGIQINVFGAMDASDAASQINTGSFVLWASSTGGFTYDFVIPIDETSGSSITDINNIPQVLVIMSNDGSDFSFESIFLADYSYSDHTESKFEGFKDGISTGSVNLSVDGSLFEKTFTTSDLSQTIFGNVDEVRISNTNGSSPQFWAGFNNITIGEPVPQAPSTQASSVTFSSVGSTQMDIGWTNGDGANRAVFVREGTGTITDPSDNATYTASADWTTKGTQLGSSEYYCVYNGTGTSVTLTGLADGTEYTAQVYEYNGSAGSEAYNTTTATNNPNSQTTLTIPTVLSVNVPPDSTYTAGENLDLIVHYSEAVNVVTYGGRPYITITLNTGGILDARYDSGTGTDTLVFRYTVKSGNEDKNGIALGSTIVLNGGTIRSSSDVDASLPLNSVGSTTNVFVDAIDPTITSVDVPSDSTYITGGHLDFTVNFDEAITVSTTGGTPYIPVTLNTGGTIHASYLSGSETTALVFRYTIVSGNFDNDGIAVDTSIIANNGTLRDAAGNDAILTLNSVGNTTSVLVDAIAPTVTSVNVPSDGTYILGENLDFTVNFDEAVTVTTTGGTPYITVTLNTGGDVHASYLSGSETTALVFRYTVVSGNLDSDGIAMGASITENNGSLKDTAGNNATPTLNSVGSTSGVLVDAVAPAVTDVDVPADDTYVFGETLDFTVNFDDAVTVSTTGGTPYIPLTLDTGGMVEASYQNGSGTTALTFSYALEPGDIDTDGITLGSSITSNGGTLQDTVGNNATLVLNNVGSTTGVWVEADSASILSVDVPSDGTYILGQDLSFTVNYDEPIIVNTVGGTPSIPITLNTGGTVNASYQSGTGTTALVFSYTIEAGNLDSDGITVGASMSTEGGWLADTAGNGAHLTLNNVGSTTGVLVDAVAPSVTAVVVPSDSTYIAQDTLAFSVLFDDAVTVNTTGGTPYIQLDLNTGGTVNAAYQSGSGSSTLLFWYMISTGNMDDDGISLSTSITANGGTLQDDMGNNATLALNNVGSTTGVLVDALAPTVTSVDVPSNGTYANGENLDFTVNFDEAVYVVTTSGTPYITMALDTGGSVEASYQSGSGTEALLFRYTITTGNMDNDGITINPAITLNSATLKDGAGNDASITLNSVGSTTGVLVDAVAPTVTSVDVPSNGTYISGETLNFTVNFDEDVTVSTAGGTPAIAVTLNTGGTVEATYQSGSGSSALVFSYTIAAGNFDDDGIDMGSAITTHGGTIQDMAGNSADLTLLNMGSTTDVLVDAIAPTITSVGVPSDSTYITDNILEFTIHLSETVSVDTSSGVPSITLVLNGGETVKALYKGGTGSTALSFEYTVTEGDADSNGIDLADTIALNGGTMKDAIGNSVVATLNNVGTTNWVFMDAIAPEVTLLSTASSPTNLSGIPIVVHFSEPVTGFTVEDIVVNNGTKSDFLGNDTLFQVSVSPTDQGLVTVQIEADVVQDTAGNNNTGSTPLSFLYDSQAPTVVISSTVSDSTEVSPIPFTVTWSEPVTGFTLDDVDLSNGTGSNLNGNDSVYTFDVTPIAGGTVTVDIPADEAQDYAGNTNMAAGQFSVFYKDLTAIDPIMAEKSQVTVYPSVISSSMTLEISHAAHGDILVRIIQVNGALCKQLQYANTQPGFSVIIPMDDVSDGNYFIEISTDTFRELKKVVVER